MAPDRRRRRPLALLALVAALVTAVLGAGAAAQGSGLPVPRFASLGGSALNVRTGPDRQYPVRWIYERPGYPVLVVEEHDVWRRIEDAAGEGGWIHGSLLSGRRNLLVIDGPAELYRTPNADARWWRCSTRA
jgi:SH3-like domain-containing protein